jgi:hypothetical protein
VDVTVPAPVQAWRRRPVLAPLLIGAAAVVAGGLVAAASAPVASERASWAAAYLVLVVGVAQLGLVGGLCRLLDEWPSPGLIGGEFVGWNVGNAAVLAGTLLDVRPAVDAGGVLVVAALLAALAAVRSARPSGALWTYRALVVLVLVSVPVGLVLGHLRPA